MTRELLLPGPQATALPAPAALATRPVEPLAPSAGDERAVG